MVGHIFRGILVSTATLGLGLAVAAESVGSVDAISDVAGSVIVTRGGTTYSLAQDDPIFDGDRVTTRSNGAVTLTANGCTKSLEAESSVVLNSAFCNVEVVALSTGVASGASGLLVGLLAGGSQAPVILGGLSTVGAVAVAAGRSGDSGSTPTSP